MLRRAITGHHHYHRLCIAYGQWLSHPTTTILSRPPSDHLPVQKALARRPFSTSLARRQREEEGDSEASLSPPLVDRGGAPNSSLPADTIGRPSELSSSESSTPELQPETYEYDDALVADLEESSTNGKHDLPAATVAVKDDASHAHANNRRSRTRGLRPLLIPPSFPLDLLLPTTNTPSSSHSFSSSLDQEEEQNGTTTEMEMEMETAAAAVIRLADLPPNTLKPDIRTVFQHFGDVKRIVVQPDGRKAEVVFADVGAVSKVLHAYAERPLRVRGQEIIVFRKRSSQRGPAVRVGTLHGTARRGYEKDVEGDGAIFVSNFPAGTTQEEVLDALAPLGKNEGIVMRPGSKYAYVMYSTNDRAEDVLRAHERLPITIRRRQLRIECTPNRPYTSSNDSSAYRLEIGKPLDPEESSALVEELKKSVPRWKGLYEPSRVLWIGRLPSKFDRGALINFWSRLGCVVEVRTTTYGFAHVEFASTEEAIRAARQGVPHGFRYANRLLDVDFAPWLFHIGPTYRVVYISGWSPSKGRSALLQWASDIPNIVSATILAPFRGEQRTDPRGAFLQFRSIDDARAALRVLDGRQGPGGETLRVTLSSAPAIHPNRLWRWVSIPEGTEEEADFFENECDKLGFGTGKEEEEENLVDERGRRKKVWKPRVDTRGGRFKDWMKAKSEKEKNEDALRSDVLRMQGDLERGEQEQEEPVEGEEGEGEDHLVPLSAFLRPTRRHQLTSMARDSSTADREPERER